MDDLITWLRAQLDEDQWHAEEAQRSSGAHIRLAIGKHGGPLFICADPARMHAEVEAKRRILAEHRIEDTGADVMPRACRRCGSFGNCLTVRLLALPYADRPGYREEWRP